MNRSNKFLIGSVITLLTISVLFSHETEEMHLHEVVECRYAQGVKSYNLTFCHTDSAQVTLSGQHLYNQRAERFFKGQLCRK